MLIVLLTKQPTAVFGFECVRCLSCCRLYFVKSFTVRSNFSNVSHLNHKNFEEIEREPMENNIQVTTEPWKSKWSSFQIYSLRTMSFQWQIFLFVYFVVDFVPCSILQSIGENGMEKPLNNNFEYNDKLPWLLFFFYRGAYPNLKPFKCSKMRR